MPDDLHNPDLEAESEKDKHSNTFVSVGREATEAFNKQYALNWTYRNDFAKIVITLSSGLLALLVTLSSSSLFKAVPMLMLVINMVFLLLSIAFNLASLWIIIKATLIGHDFMQSRPAFAKKFAETIKEHGRFEPFPLEDFFSAPFKKACKSHDLAYSFLRWGLIFFCCSLLILFSIGVMSMTGCNPVSSINLSSAKSPQSWGSQLGAKCLPNK